MPVKHDVGSDRKIAGPAVMTRSRRMSGIAPIPRLMADELVEGACELNQADREMVHAVYARGVSVKALATIHSTSTRRLRQRLRRIIARLRSPLFRLVLRERECGNWPAERRAIAVEVVLRGRTQREVAHEQGVSLHHVRTELEHLKALAGVHRLRGDV